MDVQFLLKFCSHNIAHTRSINFLSKFIVLKMFYPDAAVALVLAKCLPED